MRSISATLLGMTALLLVSQAHAASLQVAPVMLDIAANGSAATSLNLRNSGTAPVNAQVRIYRWKQIGGKDTFEETNSVAVAPPIVKLAPGVNYTIRIVRLDRSPIAGEEAYRVIADELPDADAQRAGTVKLIVRHSIPVFFRSPQASQASVNWTISRQGGRLMATAHNEGDRHMRIAKLRIGNGGRSLNYGNGLVGYVLGKSSRSFPSTNAHASLAPGNAPVNFLSNYGLAKTNAIVR